MTRPQPTIESRRVGPVGPMAEILSFALILLASPSCCRLWPWVSARRTRRELETLSSWSSAGAGNRRAPPARRQSCAEASAPARRRRRRGAVVGRSRRLRPRRLGRRAAGRRRPRLLGRPAGGSARRRRPRPGLRRRPAAATLGPRRPCHSRSRTAHRRATGSCATAYGAHRRRHRRGPSQAPAAARAVTPTLPIRAAGPPPRPPATAARRAARAGVRLGEPRRRQAVLRRSPASRSSSRRCFFLRYSIEQGWLQPPVRVAIGILVAIALLVVCELKAARQYPATANALDARGDRHPVRDVLRRARAVEPDPGARRRSRCWRW